MAKVMMVVGVKEEQEEEHLEECRWVNFVRVSHLFLVCGSHISCRKCDTSQNVMASTSCLGMVSCFMKQW
jgi:hypothetical protein